MPNKFARFGFSNSVQICLCNTTL